METSINKFMPRNVSKILHELEELYRKLEYEFEEFSGVGEESICSLGEAIDALIEINDELDQDLEDE